MKGVTHYKKDGSIFKGKGTHKMSGQIHSGKSHTKASVRLYHLKELPKLVQKKLKKKK